MSDEKSQWQKDFEAGVIDSTPPYPDRGFEVSLIWAPVVLPLFFCFLGARAVAIKTKEYLTEPKQPQP